MKYLKHFNESLDNDIRSNIKDILLEIEDKGIYSNIYCQEEDFPTGNPNYMAISITSKDLFNNHTNIWLEATPFMMDNDIFSSLEHLDNYLNDIGYKIHTISFKGEGVDGRIHQDSVGDLSELKNLIGVWYDSFESMSLKYKKYNLQQTRTE
jgi:hypothetical protein